MTNAELFCFAGKCLALDGRPGLREEVAALVSGGVVPWEKFVWTGSSHFVLPALFTSFDRNGILPMLPEELTEHMRHIYNLNAERNRRIVMQCRQISQLLFPAGIRPVFLKGAALLLMGLYKDMGDRMMEDIDLLLPEAEIPPALEILQKGGYLQHPVDEGKGEVYADHHHLPPMYHPGQVATLEIHRYPVHGEIRELIPEEAVLTEAVPGNASSGIAVSQGNPGEHPFFVTSPCHAGVLVFLHELRMGKGYLSSAGTLKGAFDFYLLSKLRPPEPGDLPEGKFRKKYLRYGWVVEKIMGINGNGSFPHSATFIRCNRWWLRELFLLNHPRIDLFWHEYLYAPALFLKLLVSSIWSRSDRKLVIAKLRNYCTKTFRH